EVGLLAGGKTSDARLAPEVTRAIQRRDADGLERREPRIDEQFNLSLVGEAGNDAARPGRIGPGDQQTAGACERQFELLGFREQPQVWRFPVLCDTRVVLVELLLELRRQ